MFNKLHGQIGKKPFVGDFKNILVCLDFTAFPVWLFSCATCSGLQRRSSYWFETILKFVDLKAGVKKF